MKKPLPVRPSDLDPLAEELLTGLGRFPGARHIVLGGYFALKHYCDYRLTHDVDGWWTADSSASDREEVRQAMGAVLGELCRKHGLGLNTRRFGDTEAWQLLRGNVKIFSFQIAARTLQLEPYLASPWPPLQIESLADNVASKMNALVQRGAPRDFVDVRQLVAAGLLNPDECWELWRRKNPDLALADARLHLAHGLEALERRRPLETIADPEERERARATRAWFRQIFLSLPKR